MKASNCARFSGDFPPLKLKLSDATQPTPEYPENLPRNFKFTLPAFMFLQGN